MGYKISEDEKEKSMMFLDPDQYYKFKFYLEHYK